MSQPDGGLMSLPVSESVVSSAVTSDSDWRMPQFGHHLNLEESRVWHRGQIMRTSRPNCTGMRFRLVQMEPARSNRTRAPQAR